MSKVTLEHTEARTRAILESATRVFSRKGIQAATMAEIADDAGVSAGALYRYFPGKEALAAACLAGSAEEMLDDWRRKAEGPDDPLAVFNEIARQSFEEIESADAGDLTRLMLENTLTASRSADPLLREAIQAQQRTIVTGLEEALRRAQDAGQIAPSIPSQHLAAALLAFYMGARMARLLTPETDTAAQLEAVRTLLELASGRDC